MYQAKGLEQLYQWQAAALECGEAGNNLVYCAPTSGGKTVVAEILMIRKLLATARAGMVPYRQVRNLILRVYLCKMWLLLQESQLLGDARAKVEKDASLP